MRKVGDAFMPDVDVMLKVVEAVDIIPILPATQFSLSNSMVTTGSMPAGLAMGVTQLGLVGWSSPPVPAGLVDVAVVEAPDFDDVEEDAGTIVGDA